MGYIDFDLKTDKNDFEPHALLANRIKSQPGMVAGSSHHHAYPLPRLNGIKFIDLVFLGLLLIACIRCIAFYFET